MSPRWYSPETGRFLSRASYPPNIEHPYTFCENNPLSYIDPYGLERRPGQSFSDCVQECVSGAFDVLDWSFQIVCVGVCLTLPTSPGCLLCEGIVLGVIGSCIADCIPEDEPEEPECKDKDVT